MGFDHFYVGFLRNAGNFGEGFGRFWSNLWPFAHFLPTFKTPIWSVKTQYLCGFAGSKPTFPLFFLNYYDRKFKVYSNSTKKVGFWPRAKKMEEIMSKISWESLYENFKSIYPRLSRSSVYFRPFGYMSIVVYFENGMKMVYDDLRKQAYITA